MTALTREAILAAQDLTQEVVSVPAWGGDVIVRSMTGLDRDNYEQWVEKSKTDDPSGNLRNVRARLVAFCVVDEAGTRVFTEQDIDALGAKSAKALEAIFNVALRLNAIGPADVEALAKN